MNDSLPDLERMLQERAGGERGPSADERLIEVMLRLYRARLLRMAESILRDRQEAEDAVQQAFVSAALHLERYQPGSNFTAWLYTIAVNACRGMLRRRKRHQALSRLLEQLANTPKAHPEARVLQNEADRHLWQAVDELDEKQRLVVVLRYQEELPVHQIAQILAIPEATVYTRLYAAFQKLRGQLNEADEYDAWAGLGRAERLGKDAPG